MKALKKYLPYFLIVTILIGLAFSPLTASHSSAQAGIVVDTLGAGLLDSIMSTVAYAVLWLVARVTWIAGAMLDLSVYFSLNLSLLLPPGSNNIVTIGWTIFRDLANVFFIFILLYMGIKTIIGLPFDKGVFVRFIVVALLINFSLFISRIVIDSSNILALQFYKAIRPNYTMDLSNPDFYLDNISSQFMYGLKLSSTYDPKAGEDKTGANVGFEGGSVVSDSATTVVSKKIIVMLLGSVLLLVAAFVFFAAAILFTIRTVVLMLLMILSPLAFIGSLIPKTQSYAQQWWDQLFNQSFFAPAYLVLTYVVLKSLDSFQNIVAPGATMSSALGGFALTSVSVIMNYIILIVLMLSSLVVAKKMGAAGADFAQKTAGKLTGATGFGLAGFVGRQTAGRLGQMAAKSSWAQGVASKTGFAGAASRLALKTAQGAAGSTFDLRATKLSKNVLSQIPEAGGIMSHFGDEIKTPAQLAKEKTKEREEEMKTQTRIQTENDNRRLSTTISTAAPSVVSGIVRGLDKEQFKAIDPKIFANNPAAAEHLNMDQINKLQQNPNLTQDDRRAIRNHILAGAPGTSVAERTFMTTGPGSVLWA